tara:strand:+ start:731 stop:961 length:231 start_codon:yes stop_codon:yes gene_type:complete
MAEKSAMTAADIGNFVRGAVGKMTNWIRLFVALALAVLIAATIAAVAGHPIPYVPGFKVGLQEVGIFSACIAYWLK